VTIVHRITSPCTVDRKRETPRGEPVASLLSPHEA
jgi:hypothetical protein